MRQELINDIAQALERMERKGFRDTFYYERLKAKRDALVAGKEYQLVNVGVPIVAMLGASVPEVNRGFDARPIKPRGDKVKAIKSSIPFYLQELLDHHQGKPACCSSCKHWEEEQPKSGKCEKMGENTVAWSGRKCSDFDYALTGGIE